MNRPVLRSILYVEDDPHVRALVKMALEIIGHLQVRECCSGRAALEAAPDCEADLILLDLAMPGLDGLATLGLLRRFPHLARTPVIFLTGHTACDNVMQFQAAGAIGMIAKPIEPLRLAAQVRALWDKPAAPDVPDSIQARSALL